MTSLFEDLPKPDLTALTVYAIGSGYGESQVVVLPGGRVMVVDAAVASGSNLTLALLDHLGVDVIDRLVLTHPDTDHVRGVADVLESRRVHHLWRYPAGTMVRDLLATVLRVANRKLKDDHQKRRLLDLQNVHKQIADAMGDDMVVEDAVAGGSPWRPPGAAWEVHPIAPTSYDCREAMTQWEEVIELGADAPAQLTQRAVAALESGHWSERPNHVSVALVVRWGDIRILLAGDVEQRLNDERSGWRGVLRQIDRMVARADLTDDVLSDLTVVKVAHHGSAGAFCDEAWARHSRTRSVPVSVIMPFNRQARPLPHAECLTGLLQHTGTLVLTSPAGDSTQRLRAAGWHSAQDPVGAATAPIAMFSVLADGSVRVQCGQPASRWLR